MQVVILRLVVHSPNRAFTVTWFKGALSQSHQSNLKRETVLTLQTHAWRLCSTTAARGVAGELEDENWRLGSTTLVRGGSGEWEDENWFAVQGLGSTTLVRGVSGELEDENWRLGSSTT